ncbi:hypothetical protein FQZ97_782410 [compost metagenome]
MGPAAFLGERCGAVFKAHPAFCLFTLVPVQRARLLFGGHVLGLLFIRSGSLNRRRHNYLPLLQACQLGSNQRLQGLAELRNVHIGQLTALVGSSGRALGVG